MKEMILGQLLESKGKIHKERLTASAFEESTNEISDSFDIINSSKCKTNTNKIFRKIEGFEESTNEISDSFDIINSSKCKTNTNKIFRKIEGFETKAKQSSITKKSLADKRKNEHKT